MLQQKETRAFCQEHAIAIESYNPLMRGKDVLESETIVDLARKYGKTPAHITLRCHVQSGFIVIPKSVTPERIRENIDLFDFELSTEEMHRIEASNADKRLGTDPDTAAFK